MNNLKPTIAFFGSSLVSAYRNGAALYFRGIIKYLHKLGYKVTFYEPDAYERQANRDIPDPEWAEVVIWAPDIDSLEKALERAANADIIIKASGVGVFDDFLERAIPGMRKPSQRIVFWDVDAPATLDSVINNPGSEYRKLIPQYDFILTYGGGDPVVNAYRSLNARECIPVYNALDPETHYRVPAQGNFACDLSFLGNRLPDREEKVKRFFLDVADRMPEQKFLLGGSGWEDLSIPRNLKYVNHVFSSDHNAFNSSSRIVLNISRQSIADYGFSPATRVFEAAGAGACIITDYWKGIENFLIPGTEVLVALDDDDVEGFLVNTDKAKARRIGEAARAKVLSEHTYEKRAILLDRIFAEQEVTRS